METMNEAIYPAIYEAEIYNDIQQHTEHVKGITFAPSFSIAMMNIESYYGEELMSVKIELQEEQTVWELETTKTEF